MNVNSVINHCLGLSRYGLENFAGENYSKVYYYCEKIYDGEEVNQVLISSIFTCVAADGKISESEWRFIASFVGGYTYDEAFEVAGSFYNASAQSSVREICRLLPTEILEAFLSLCIAVLAVDGKMEGDEISFLRSLL